MGGLQMQARFRLRSERRVGLEPRTESQGGTMRETSVKSTRSWIQRTSSEDKELQVARSFQTRRVRFYISSRERFRMFSRPHNRAGDLDGGVFADRRGTALRQFVRSFEAVPWRSDYGYSCSMIRLSMAGVSWSQ